MRRPPYFLPSVFHEAAMVEFEYDMTKWKDWEYRTGLD